MTITLRRRDEGGMCVGGRVEDVSYFTLGNFRAKQTFERKVNILLVSIGINRLIKEHGRKIYL